jgi:phosphate transport system substrate-binding protein
MTRQGGIGPDGANAAEASCRRGDFGGQLDRILSATGNRGGTPIRTWGELGLTGDWADEPIHIVGIQPWNGFEEFVRQRVMDANGMRGETSPDEDFTFRKTVFDVAGDNYALGYRGRTGTSR